LILAKLKLRQLILCTRIVQEFLFSHCRHSGFLKPVLQVGLHHTITAEAIFGDGLAIDLVGNRRMLGAIIGAFIPGDRLNHVVDWHLCRGNPGIIARHSPCSFLPSSDTQPLPTNIGLRPAKIIASYVPSLDRSIKKLLGRRHIALSEALNAPHGHLGVHLTFVVLRGLGIPAMKVAKPLSVLCVLLQAGFITVFVLRSQRRSI